MSRAVGVLAVMDDVISEILIPNGGSYVDAMDEARDAVAELVEAIKESREALQAFANNGMPPLYRRHMKAERRLDAALAKFGAAA